MIKVAAFTVRKSYPILQQYYTIQIHHEELPYALYTELSYATAILHNSNTPREELPYTLYSELPYATAILHNSNTPRRVTLYSLYRVTLCHCNTTQFKYTTKSYPIQT